LGFLPKSFRSITLPIVLGVLAIILTIAMSVGWVLVIIQNVALSQQVSSSSWLMAAGVLSFVVITMVLVLFSVFLVRAILEQRRQVRFIDSVTHELKSPLASLKLCVETLDRRALEGEQRHELHQMMLDDIDRLSAFIDDILEASRAGYGPGNAHWNVVQLDVLTARCAARVRERHKVGTDALRLDIPTGVLMLTDPTALEVVLRNLLDNAVKYSDPAAVQVVVEARVDDSRVVIRVRDQGIGIPAQHIKLVFDRFYRAPLESVASRRGTGLGLYVASQLVRHLGGKLEATSGGPGRGTTMAFALPVQAMEGSRPPESTPSLESAHGR
jgi:signal transduction histidine kinase